MDKKILQAKNDSRGSSCFSLNFCNSDSFCCFSSIASLYPSYVKTILHLAQNLESGLLGSLQLGHYFDLKILSGVSSLDIRPRAISKSSTGALL